MRLPSHIVMRLRCQHHRTRHSGSSTITALPPFFSSGCTPDSDNRSTFCTHTHTHVCTYIYRLHQRALVSTTSTGRLFHTVDTHHEIKNGCSALEKHGYALTRSMHTLRCVRKPVSGLTQGSCTDGHILHSWVLLCAAIISSSSNHHSLQGR